MNLAFNEDQMPVRIRFDKPISDDALMRFSTQNDGMRMERNASGELIVMSPTGFASSNMNVRIARLLDEWAERDGRGTTTESSGGYSLEDGSVRAPDAAWISFHRLRPLSEKEKTGYVPVCPEFVIELKSPSDRLPELEAKMEMWIANGAELAWFIDPERKVVAIYRPSESPEVLYDPTSVQGTGPVAGFELMMARVWQ